MKVFKLADAPLDADPLEYELWRSVTNPVGQPPADLTRDKPLAATEPTRPFPSPANQSRSAAAENPQPVLRPAAPANSAQPPHSQPPAAAPRATPPAPAAAPQPFLRPAAPANAARPPQNQAPAAPRATSPAPVAAPQPFLRPAAPANASRPPQNQAPAAPRATPPAPTAAPQPTLRAAAPANLAQPPHSQPPAASLKQPAALQTPPANVAVAPPVHYDWDSRVTIAEQPAVEIPSSILDKATQAYRQVAQKAAWLQGASSRRRWALGIAGVAVLGGLGAGMALLSGPPRDEPEAIAAAQPAPVETAQAAQPVDGGAQPVPPKAEEAAAPVPASASAAMIQPQASPPTPAPSSTMLETSDARWARTDELSAVEPADPQPVAAAPQASADTEPGLKTASPSDAATTGSITRVNPAPKTPPKPAAKAVKTKAAPSDDELAGIAGNTAAQAGQTSSAVVTMAVKMRAGADNKADVVKVVPANASVEVISCKVWCKVAFDGKEGFIFKRFVKQDG